jgi:hypothetical protein
MDRHEEGGAPSRQPPQEVQLHQQLNDSTPVQAALTHARLNPAQAHGEKAREKGPAGLEGETAHARTKAHVDDLYARLKRHLCKHQHAPFCGYTRSKRSSRAPHRNG